jgi:hypothetical protein
LSLANGSQPKTSIYREVLVARKLERSNGREWHGRNPGEN